MRKSDWFVLLSRVPRTILPLTFDQLMFYIIPKKWRLSFKRIKWSSKRIICCWRNMYIADILLSTRASWWSQKQPDDFWLTKLTRWYLTAAFYELFQTLLQTLSKPHWKQLLENHSLLNHSLICSDSNCHLLIHPNLVTSSPDPVKNQSLVFLFIVTVHLSVRFF